MDHSFAILAYKESPYISDCIEALFNQKVKSQIYISTSTPSNYLENISRRYNIPLHVNPEKKGIASDWNFAISRCRTKYLTLAHQDDIYLPDYTESMMRIANQHSDCAIIFSDYGEIFNNKKRNYTLNLIIKRIIIFVNYNFFNTIKIKFRKRLLLSLGSPIPCPSVFYNLKQIQDFAFSSDFQVNLDWAAWLSLSEKKGRFGAVRKKLIYHRIHEDSETSKAISDNRRYNEDMILFNRIWPRPMAKIISFLYMFAYRSNS